LNDFVEKTLNVKEHCGARVVVATRFAAFYERDETNVDANLTKSEIHFRKNTEGAEFAYVHIGVAFLRYLLISALVDTLDLENSLSEEERIRSEMECDKLLTPKKAVKRISGKRM
jgi:hypothetical protein